MGEMVTRLHRAKLAPAIVSIIFGIALIIARRSAADVAVKIAAVMLMIGGGGCLLFYLFGPVKDSMQLAMGAVLAGFGVLAWIFSQTVVDMFPIFTGISLVLNGLSNLAALSESQDDNVGKTLIVLFSMLMIAGGLFITFHPASVENALLIYMGICYILNGLFDLILLYRVKNVILSK